MTFSEIAQKRFFGVPVIYWALAGVAVLAYVAWKIKPSSAGDQTTDNGVTPMDEADLSALNTTGTVVVQPTTQPVADAEEETNSKWIQAAIDYVVNDLKIATVGDAQTALTKYINGDDLTYDEGKIRDAAVTKLKLPPEGVAKVGQTGAQPAQRQFSNFPGKHTVKGSSDNTPQEIAQLYYGSGATDHAVIILENNLQYGALPGTTYPVGTVLTVPNYPVSKFYKVTGKNGDQYYANVAKKYGLSVAQFQALNPGVPEPIPVGRQVRVQ